MQNRYAASVILVLTLAGCGKPDVPQGADGEPSSDAQAAATGDTQQLLEEAQQALQNRDLARALDLVQQAIATDEQDPQKHLLLSQLLQWRGGELVASDREAARQHFYNGAVEARRFRELKTTPPTQQELQILSVALYKEAGALAADSQPEKSMSSLRDAIAAGFGDLELLAKDPELQSLRSRPDFQQLFADTRQRILLQSREEVRAEMAAHSPFEFSFALPDLQGKTVSLSDYKGKIVIVDFWGTWCPPCRMEVPHFIDLYNTYREQGLEIVGLNYEDGSQNAAIKTIRDFVTQNGINYPCLIGDDATRGKVPRFQGFPTTLFLDREGVVRLQLVGYHPHERLEAAVLELLEEAADRQ